MNAPASTLRRVNAWLLLLARADAPFKVAPADPKVVFGQTGWRMREFHAMFKAGHRLGGYFRMAWLPRAALDEQRYQPLGADDPRSPRSLLFYEAGSRELGTLDFVVLGEVTEQNSIGKTVGVTRWIAAPDRTACGWFAVLPAGRGMTPVRFLFSESLTPGTFFITHSGPTSVRVAQPPTIHRTEAPFEHGLAAPAVRHRELIDSSGAARDGLRTVESLDEAIALLRRLRVAARGWRLAQPADELLTADLRVILGQRFDQLARDLRPLLES